MNYKSKKALIAGVLCSAMIMTSVASTYASEITLGDSNTIGTSNWIDTIGQTIQEANSYDNLFANNTCVTNNIIAYNYSTGEAVVSNESVSQLGFNQDDEMFYYSNSNDELIESLINGTYYNISTDNEKSHISIMPSDFYDVSSDIFNTFTYSEYNWSYVEDEILSNVSYSDDGSSYTFETKLAIDDADTDDFKEYISNYGLDYTVNYINYITTVDTATNQVTKMDTSYDSNIIETFTVEFNQECMGTSYNDFISIIPQDEVTQVNLVVNANLDDETTITYDVPKYASFSLGYYNENSLLNYYNVYLDKDLTQLYTIYNTELDKILENGITLYLQDVEVNAVTHNEVLQAVLDNVTASMISIDTPIEDCQFDFVQDEVNNRDLIQQYDNKAYYMINISDKNNNVLTQIGVAIDGTSMIVFDEYNYNIVDFIYYPISKDYATQVFKYCANQLYGDTIDINKCTITCSNDVETIEKNLCYKLDISLNDTSVVTAYMSNSGKYMFIPNSNGSFDTIYIDNIYNPFFEKSDAIDILNSTTTKSFTGLPTKLSEYELVLSTNENDDIAYQYINNEICYEFSVFAKGATEDADLISMNLLLYVSNTTGNVYKYDAEGDAYILLEDTLMVGDINCDGDIKSNDLLMLKKYLLGLTDLDEQGLLNADVNQDGKVKSNDLLMLKKFLLGLIEL